MNIAQRILKNFLSLTFADIFTKFLGVVTVSYLARILGPHDFGKMNFALAVVNYFAILSNFGLNVVGAREIARCKEKMSDYVNNILTLKLCLGLVTYILLAIFVFLINKPIDIKHLVIFYGLTIFTANVFPLDWVFQGIEKMEYLGLFTILQGISYLTFILLFVHNPQQLLLIPWILFFAQLIAVFFLFTIYTKKFSTLKLKFDLPLWRKLIKEAIPIGLTGVMTIIVLNTSIVTLGFIRTEEEVGYFASAYKIILILIGISVAYSAALFPTISYYYKTSTESFNKLLHYAFKLVIIVGLSATVGITLLAKPIITLLYGLKFTPAATTLQILIWGALLAYTHAAFSHTLWAIDRQNKVFKIQTIQAVCTFLFNLIFISEFGFRGASVAFLLSGLIASLLYFYEIRNAIDLKIWDSLLKSLAASFIMGLFLYCFSNWNLFILIPLGAMTYFTCLYILKGIQKEEVNLALKTVKFNNR